MVSDLEKRGAIWFGGDGRSEADIDQFYAFLSEESRHKVRLAVMDMWKRFAHRRRCKRRKPPFCSTSPHPAPSLGEALDKIRKAEYGRVTGTKRKFIKGQKYVLLAHRENLTSEARNYLKLLWSTAMRLNTAYLLRESFDQLWDYKSETALGVSSTTEDSSCADNASSHLSTSPMIDRHWDRIAAYCRPEY